jgi:hypothetical protein
VTARLRRAGLALAAVVAAIAIGIRVILTLPGLPYNVSNMFLDHGSALALALFALALIWLGAGPMLLAHWLARSRRPYLVLPAGAAIVAMVSRTLLKYSVTYEKLDKILGTNNLFWQVTVGRIWGEFWRHALLVTNSPDLVAYVERRMRFIALYSPLVVCLALALVPVAKVKGRQVAASGPQLLGLAVSALAWLWLSKIVIIDWAATDNLTELIAQSGPFGLGGVPFLYLVAGLLATSVALLLAASDHPAGWRWLAALTCSVLAIPVGWALLRAGLDQHVEKYGLVFSGQQFLLGPDRQHALSDATLFMRWAVVQSAAVSVMFVGARIAHGAVRGPRRPVMPPGAVETA